ncbi:DUF6166 domain-containing protein [Actinoallomurus bryophytorum]
MQPEPGRATNGRSSSDLGSESQAEVIYHGWPRPDGLGAAVIESPLRTYRPLPHLVRHSPSGFNWGYDGNGPRDLALSLLTDALNEYAGCDQRPSVALSQAHSKKPLHPARPEVPPGQGSSAPDWPCPCQQHLLALPYLQFTRQVIATRLRYGKAWSMPRKEILRWLSSLATPL